MKSLRSPAEYEGALRANVPRRSYPFRRLAALSAASRSLPCCLISLRASMGKMPCFFAK